VYKELIISVCPFVSIQEPLKDFDEIWYRQFATGGYPKLIFSNLQSIIPT
jgi:hypothetical protein